MGGLTTKENELIIHLVEIGESGYHFSCTRSNAWLAGILRETGGVDLLVSADLNLRIDLFRVGTVIEARGEIRTELEIDCVRCLDHFNYPLAVEFHYSFLPAEEMVYCHEMEVARDDLDVLPYSGAVLDLVPLIGEQVIVGIPTNPLCRESCRGMCPRCGSNLNHSACQCQANEGGNSAFDVLRNFPLKQKS